MNEVRKLCKPSPFLACKLKQIKLIYLINVTFIRVYLDKMLLKYKYMFKYNKYKI